MYGTIAHFHIRPGSADDFIRVMDSFGDAVIGGWIADYYFQSDADPNEFFLVALFADKATYQTNADSAEQHERYLKFRSFLTTDPEWHDGFVRSATGPGAG
jgi:quinol monooxygenase YgiN